MQMNEDLKLLETRIVDKYKYRFSKNNRANHNKENKTNDLLELERDIQDL